MKLKIISVEEAIGKPLLHDVTGTFNNFHNQKETIFKKGHIIEEKDIELLKNSGKYHIYTCDDIDEMLHEDDVANLFVQKVLNDSLNYSEIIEGKINIISKYKGVLKVNSNLVNKLNEDYEITLATKLNYTFVEENDVIASFRIIDLFMSKSVINKLLELVTNELFRIVPINKKKIKLLTVGTEIYEKRVVDLSYDKLTSKLKKYDLEVDNQEFLIDDLSLIKSSIIKSVEDYEIILCTGGMSVDPDDFTKRAILETCDNVICNHTPFLPGSMFVLATLNNTIVLGCPANVVFNEKTVLDLFIPQILLNELPTTKEIMSLGYGALK